jgi:Holliday junction resolvase RusA-like endonuclease
MTRRGKFVNKEAKESLTSQEAMSWQIKSQRNGSDMLPARTPLRATLIVEQPRGLHKFDLDNLLKATIDAAQGIAFENDLWIDELHAIRRPGKDYKTVLSIEPLAGPGLTKK